MIKICVVADSFSLNMSGYCELTLFVTSFGNKTAWCSPAVKSFATQLKLQLFFLKELQLCVSVGGWLLSPIAGCP